MAHKRASLSRTYRHMTRYREIIQVLVKHGFGDLITRSNVERYIDRGRKLLPGRSDAEIASLSRWERVRMVLEELGPTFIKFGQIMSNRPDLLPQELIAELAKLQSEVPPFSDEEAKNLIEEELGRPVSEIFAEYSPTPIASASIAQVHRATLLHGEEVAIKVQRPGIEQIIKTDLEIMFDLATLMEKHIQEMDILHPVAVVKEFKRSIKREIDFNIEAAAIERFGRNFQDDDTIYVPKVYRDYSTRKVLTMEFIDGVKASSAEVLINAGLDPKLLASRGADLVLKQVFEHGFFHADPHPGNMVALPENVVCFLDFGMMGSLSLVHREALSNILVGVVNQDAAGITKTVLKLARNQYIEDAEQLEYEIYELLEQYSHRSLKSVNMGVLLNQMVSVVVKHRLRIPPNFYLLSKALITIEGVGRLLDPDFDMVKHTEPFAKKLLRERLNPLKLTKDFYLSVIDLSILLRDLPAETREILAQIKEGKTRIEFEHKGLDPMLKTLDQISNRISFSIVLSSLIVGSALIMRAEIPPKVYGVPIIGALGFVAAGVMGFWLLVSILRHGKM